MFEQVKSGQPVRFSARKENLTSRVLDDYQAGLLGGKGDPDTRIPKNPAIIKLCPNRAVDPFDVMALGSLLVPSGTIQEGKLECIENGVRCYGVPPFASGTETVCVVLHGAAEFEPVKAVVAGPTRCAVYVRNTDHRYARLIADDTKRLESCESGNVKILSPVTQTGEEFHAVMLGVQEPPTSGVLVSELPIGYGSHAIVDLSDGRRVGVESWPNVKIQKTVAAGKGCVVQLVGAKWRFMLLDC